MDAPLPAGLRQSRLPGRQPPGQVTSDQIPRPSPSHCCYPARSFLSGSGGWVCGAGRRTPRRNSAGGGKSSFPIIAPESHHSSAFHRIAFSGTSSYSISGALVYLYRQSILQSQPRFLPSLAPIDSHRPSNQPPICLRCPNCGRSSCLKVFGGIG